VADTARARRRARRDPRRRGSDDAGAKRRGSGSTIRPARPVRGPRARREASEVARRAPGVRRGARTLTPAAGPRGRLPPARAPRRGRPPDPGAGGPPPSRVDASPEPRRNGDLFASGTVYANATAPIAADGRVTNLALGVGLRPVDREGEVRLAAEAELGADV